MTQDQVVGILRQLFTMAGGIAVGKGWVTADMLTAVIGALAPVVSIYFVWKKASAAGQIAAVTANPDVQKVVTTSAVANSQTFAANTKVVTQ